MSSSNDISKRDSKRKQKRSSKNKELETTDNQSDAVEMTALSPRLQKLRDSKRKSNSPKSPRNSSRKSSRSGSRSSFYDDNLPDENTTLGRIYRALDLRKEYEVSTEHDLYLRIESAKGIPAPSPGIEADVYWQLDMGTNLRHITKTVFMKTETDDEWVVDAYWGEDIFIRRGSSDQLLLTLRSKALGYNASFGKVAISSLEELIKDVPDNSILTDWFPLAMNFKSSDKSRQYDLKVRLYISKLPTLRPKDDKSAYIGAPPKGRNISVIPSPLGVCPGSNLDALVVLHRPHGSDKIAKGDLQLSIEGQQAAYVEGKLNKKIQKRKSILFTPDPEAYKISFPGIVGILTGDSFKVDLNRELRRSPSFLTKLKDPQESEFDKPGTYAWKVKVPIPGKTKVVQEDEEEQEIPPTILPPSYKFGSLNVWEPIKKGAEGKVSGEARHLVRVDIASHESVAEFKVHPVISKEHPISPKLEFKSPFHKEDTFIISGRFKGDQISGPWTFEGNLESESNKTTIKSVSVELRYCLSMSNAGDGFLSSPLHAKFGGKENDLLPVGSKTVSLEKKIEESLPGYTMITPLWQIEYYLVPTVIFKSESGETKKKELDGVAIGIYPNRELSPEEKAQELLSEDMEIKTEILDFSQYVALPNVFYHPESKSLVDIPQEDPAHIYDIETGKKVESSQFFNHVGNSKASNEKKKANRKSKKLSA